MSSSFSAQLGLSSVCPAAMQPGDEVRILSPSSAFDEALFAKGLQVIKDMGLRPTLAENLRGRQHYLAGEDAMRLADLRQALSEPDLKFIWAARGGYGATRLLPELAQLRPRTPKLLLGFSDISALHARWFSGFDQASVHAPVLTTLGDEPEDSIAHLQKILRGQARGLRLSLDAEANNQCPQGITGRIFASNLTLLATLAGTPFMPDLSACILVVEEVNERPYHLDRLWTQIRQSGLLAGVEAIVLGDFYHCDEANGQLSAEDGLALGFQGLRIPVYRGLKMGHRAPNFALPIGVRARLQRDSLTFLENVVISSHPETELREL